jgi:acetyl-CoA carboxylase biotin carboxyl carrier protein
MTLTNDDIQEIIRVLDSSFGNELRIKTDGFDLYLRRSGTGWTQEMQTLRAPQIVGNGKHARATSPEKKDPPPLAERETEGVVNIRAPMMGTFYRAPKPGAPPFVEVGAVVGVDTVICIVETMKLMNSVNAGVAGEIAEICVADGQVIETDQVLMRLKKAAS